MPRGNFPLFSLRKLHNSYFFYVTEDYILKSGCLVKFCILIISQLKCICGFFLYEALIIIFVWHPPKLDIIRKRLYYHFNIITWMYLSHEMPLQIKLKLEYESFELRKHYFQSFVISAHCVLSTRGSNPLDARRPLLLWPLQRKANYYSSI